MPQNRRWRKGNRGCNPHFQGVFMKAGARIFNPLLTFDRRKPITNPARLPVRDGRQADRQAGGAPRVTSGAFVPS
jgi:hypothetical protein